MASWGVYKEVAMTEGKGRKTSNLLTECTQRQVTCHTFVTITRWCFHPALLTKGKCVSSAMQLAFWAVLLWPSLFTLSVPLDCGDDQGNLSRCTSITQEKLLDRVIQHAELIYRVSEESCSLFVSKTWLSSQKRIFKLSNYAVKMSKSLDLVWLLPQR